MSPIMCQWKDLHEPHTCWDQLSCTCAHQLPHMPHCCLGWSSSTYDGTRKGPHWYQLSCTQSCLLPPVPHSHQDPHDLGCCCLCNTSSLDWIWTPWVGLGNRTLCVVHTQRWNWSYSWTSGSVKLGKKSWNLSSPLNKLQSDASTNGFVNSTHIEHLSEQMFPNAKKGLALAAVAFVKRLQVDYGPCQSLSCCHSTHSVSRSMIAMTLRPDISGSILMT